MVSAHSTHAATPGHQRGRVSRVAGVRFMVLGAAPRSGFQTSARAWSVTGQCGRRPSRERYGPRVGRRQIRSSTVQGAGSGHSRSHSTRGYSARQERPGWTTHPTWTARTARASTPWTIRCCLVDSWPGDSAPAGPSQLARLPMESARSPWWLPAWSFERSDHPGSSRGSHRPAGNLPAGEDPALRAGNLD
jgi:hypothetical protein